MSETDDIINEKENREILRQYIWLCETGMPYIQPEPSLETSHFLGRQDGTGYYFFYEQNKESVLDMGTLAIIRSKCDHYIIHAHHCLLSQEYLRQCNIVFKKIPVGLKLKIQKKTMDTNLPIQRSTILNQRIPKG